MFEKMAENGGDGEIRTLGTDVSVRRFSKPLVSATHPRLRIAAAKGAYSGGGRGRQGWFLGVVCGSSEKFAGGRDSLWRNCDSVGRRAIAAGWRLGSIPRWPHRRSPVVGLCRHGSG